MCRDPAPAVAAHPGPVTPAPVDSLGRRPLAAALEGCGGVFVCLPIASGLRERAILRAAEEVAAAVRASGVARAVWTSSWLASRAGVRVSPQFDALRDAQQAALGAGVPTLVLEPAGYLENLLTPDSAAALRAGRLPYTLPERFAYRWVSATDQARVAGAALAAGSPPHGVHPLGVTRTGGQLAAEVGAGLGRGVRYEEVTPAAFAELWRPKLGDAADAIAGDCRVIASNPRGLGLEPPPPEAEAFPGVAYTPIADWAAASGLLAGVA